MHELSGCAVLRSGGLSPLHLVGVYVPALAGLVGYLQCLGTIRSREISARDPGGLMVATFGSRLSGLGEWVFG
jgi:hypothetical protein